MKGLNERQLAQVDRLYVDAIRNMRDVLNESLGRLARLESALGMKKCAWCSRWVATKVETGGQEVPRPGVTLTELMIWQRCGEGQRPKNYLCPTCVAAVGDVYDGPTPDPRDYSAVTPTHLGVKPKKGRDQDTETATGEAREAVVDKAYDDFDAGYLRGWKDAEREAAEVLGGGGLSPEAKPTFAGLTLEGTVVARATDPPRRKKGKGGKA